MNNRNLRRTTMLVMVLLNLMATLSFQSGVHSQDSTSSVTSTTSTSTAESSTTTSQSTTTTTVSPSDSGTVTSTSTVETPSLPEKTPGPAVNPFPPGTVNCLDFPYCGANEECYVLKDGLVCLDKAMNWGYILSRNDSGVPSVPSWSGKRSELGANCTLLQMPESADKPGLALMVYGLIKDTIPQDLLLSHYDGTMTNWYTQFSNCEPQLACVMGKCKSRPTIGESCTTSWQCNPLALGLNEKNSPILGANMTGIRCEFSDGDMSFNKTCQLLKREIKTGSGFSLWHILVPIAALLVVAYLATILYKRKMKNPTTRKWSRISDDDRNDYQLEAYEDLR